MTPPRFTAARGRFVCLGQDYFVSLGQVSFGWPVHLVSLVQDWKELVSLGPNLGHLVSLDQVSFGWPKQS